MFDIKTIIPVVLKRIDAIEIGKRLELKTYKRDRGVTIIKLAADQLKIIEDGFDKNEIIIPVAKLKKTLRTLLKKEFPRSNKVRLSESPD
ncbi:MAG: hypothetical protein H8E41_00695 [Desulfobulbaceae bacterium]|uniref:Uncharacterized protein n=1 Tax=Candidatus Desulfobia pelagia TaxID=2841692 RepID=A0A8J6N9H0_9BACT|nr:hypothetical protein [Candidatus Desulfobia pelagia]